MAGGVPVGAPPSAKGGFGPARRREWQIQSTIMPPW